MGSANPRYSLVALWLYGVACAAPAPVPPATHPQPVAAPSSAPSPPLSGRRVFLYDEAVLARHKARWQTNRQQPAPALARLLEDARKALAVKPFSVVEKTILPVSGDKHDYLSLAPYYWPDPARPGCLPDVRRDATRMNPHLSYAQAVRGESEGRAAGSIDSHGIAHLVSRAAARCRSFGQPRR